MHLVHTCDKNQTDNKKDIGIRSFKNSRYGHRHRPYDIRQF